MVLYKCDKCGREFDRKSTFDFHINRKFSCVKIESNKNQITYTELQNKNKELEDEKKIQNLTDKNIELQNKNKELEDKIKQLEDKTLILYTQNKEKQKLLNNKDIEIKNLYQNKITKNKDDGDIKIKMVQGYVYIIRECDFVRLNENIYKIGRTAKTNPEDRFQKYRSKANYENEVFIISRN